MTAATYPDIAAFLVAQLDRLEGLATRCEEDEGGRWFADDGVWGNLQKAMQI